MLVPTAFGLATNEIPATLSPLLEQVDLSVDNVNVSVVVEHERIVPPETTTALVAIPGDEFPLTWPDKNILPVAVEVEIVEVPKATVVESAVDEVITPWVSPDPAKLAPSVRYASPT